MTFEHSHKPPKRNLEIPQELIVRMAFLETLLHTI